METRPLINKDVLAIIAAGGMIGVIKTRTPKGLIIGAIAGFGFYMVGRMIYDQTFTFSSKDWVS